MYAEFRCKTKPVFEFVISVWEEDFWHNTFRYTFGNLHIKSNVTVQATVNMWARYYGTADGPKTLYVL